MCAEGEASSGGYSGVGEVRRRGGADGSRNEELGIWKTEEEENSGKDSTFGERRKRIKRVRPESKSRYQTWKEMEKTFMSVVICQCLTMTNRVALATKLC